MKLAVYTAYCGVPERSTFVPYELDHRYPHYFFYNFDGFMTTPRGLGWKMVHMETELSEDPVVSAMQSKFPRVFPNKLKELEEYDFVLWVDDKCKLDLNDIEFHMEQMKRQNSPIAMKIHPSRDIQLKNKEYNVLFDFATSMYQWRYRRDWDKMIQYITEEIEAGYTLRSNLYHTTTVMLRDMRHPDIDAINNMWYDHIQRCGPQCQISFHFVKQRFKGIYTLPDNILKY